jgi:hypothetical protein
MNAHEIPASRSAVAKVVDELERGGGGSPADIAQRLGPDWTEDRVRPALAELFSGGVVGHNPELEFWWVRMNHLNRTVDACRDAGLPIIDERDCTCGLRGRLVVLVGARGLRVVWPYDERCPVHGHARAD